MAIKLEPPRLREALSSGHHLSWPARLTARNALLGCGAVASTLYIAADIAGALRYPGYSYVDQTVSELSASGAPTRPFMIAVNGVLYAPLITAFAVGVWRFAGPKRTARITGALLLGHAIVVSIWWFFPMDQRAVLAAGKESFRSSMHIPVGAVNVFLFLLPAIGVGAGLLGRRFRFYSYATIIAALVFGGLTSLQAGHVAANQPTPFAGLEERVSVYGPVLWFAALSLGLLHSRGPHGSGRG